MYAPLNQPFFDMTVNPHGFPHRMAGILGDDPVVFDTTSTDVTGGLIDPNAGITAPIESSPIEISPVLDALPLSPVSTDSSLMPLTPVYPDSIGTEFISQGDGTYMNIQTGQIVPMTTAQAVTAATTGAATANLSTVGTQDTVTLTDPNTGITSTVATNNLTPTAQALQAAGQLINAAGKLTAQGQALANSGQLYNAPPPAASGLSASVASLGTWFGASTVIAGIPNWGILAGALIAVSLLNRGGSPRRRR